MPQSKLSLFRKEIEDEYSRENYKRILNFLNSFPLFKGKFEFAQYVFKKTGLHTIKHHFNFVPKDAFIVYKSDPSVTVTLNQDLWNATTIAITVSAVPVTVRLFVGRYEETSA